MLLQLKKQQPQKIQLLFASEFVWKETKYKGKKYGKYAILFLKS